MTTPYQMPQSDLINTVETKRERLGRVLSYFSLLLLTVVLGLAVTIESLIQSYLVINYSNVIDSRVIAGGISKAYVSLLLSLIFSIPSFISIFIVLFLTTFRSKGFYCTWVFMGVVLVLSIPLGTLFGLVLLLACFSKRKEFGSF